MSSLVHRRRSVVGAAELLALLLVFGVIALGQPLIARAGPQGARVRFEGYVKEIAPNQWNVGDVQVVVDQSTVINEDGGPAELYAWVVVWATHYGIQTLHADSIAVTREAMTAGPVSEYSGVLTKRSADAWVVSGKTFVVSDRTHVVGEPAEGELVSVVADDDKGVLHALEVETLAGGVMATPVEFEGIVGAVDPVSQSWLLDDSTVFYDGDTQYLNGAPATGQTIEVVARLHGNGHLVATLVHIKAGESVLRWARSPQNEQSASPADGEGPAARSAASWSAPQAIVDHRDHAASPALAYTPDGATHAVWEDQGELLYARRPATGHWSDPIRVAAGQTPVVAATDDGALHLLFSHQFIENYEIYYVTAQDGQWSLPVNVSHTSGRSLSPTLAVTQGYQLHAAWMDDTSGDWLIYTGELPDGFWNSQPVPNARGNNPVLAAGVGGDLFLTWQGMAQEGSLQTPDVFVSQGQGGDWTLPVNISDSAGVPSTDATIAATGDGLVHIAWVEDGHDLAYSYGRDLTWSVPQPVASAVVSAQEPHLATDRSAVLILTWLQDQTIQAMFAPAHSGQWLPAGTVATLPVGGQRDVVIAARPRGGVSVGWIQASPDGSAGEIGVFESSRASMLGAASWFPLVVHP